jgi:hypothetical protein
MYVPQHVVFEVQPNNLLTSLLLILYLWRENAYSCSLLERNTSPTHAILMPVQPFAVDLRPLNGCDSPFSQVDDILTLVVNCGFVKINTQRLLTFELCEL